MSFHETIAKVLDKDTSLAEKIRTLFREQGITIASILTAIGMAIGVLVEALLPGGGGAATLGGGEPPPKDEKGLKEWIRNKLKALASLLGRLGIKAAEALPGIIGGIISWILNRAKDVVGWVSQNLWALVVGIGGLIYTYLGRTVPRALQGPMVTSSNVLYSRAILWLNLLKTILWINLLKTILRLNLLKTILWINLLKTILKTILRLNLLKTILWINLHFSILCFNRGLPEHFSTY